MNADKVIGYMCLFTVFLLLFTMLMFSLGLITGRRQANDWNTTSVHHSLELDGYKYCPYCGESLKEEK